MNAQRSVLEISENHRMSLKNYLNNNPDFEFFSEKNFEELGNLKIARDFFGSSFKPYYNVGDYNGDGYADFSVVLFKGEHIWDKSAKYRILIFNGIRSGKFELAHIKTIDYDPNVFIYSSKKWSKGHLYYGYLETDGMFCFRPTGKGYIEEYCGSE